MRRVFLAGSFVVLVAALVLTWNHRYERVPGLPDWDLAMLRPGVPEVPGVEWLGPPDNPVLRLKVDGRNPRVALRLVIPDSPAVESLLLEFRLNASGLTPGREKWQTGRFMIEWHPTEGGTAVEKDPVAGIKLDQDSGRVSLVAVPVRRPAVPAIVLEHLGAAGGFDASGLQITPVREHALWKTGRWFLLVAAFAWLVACIRSWQQLAGWRVFSAAAICLLMIIEFAVPGPWKVQKPMVIRDFQLGETLPAVQAPPSVKAMLQPPITPGAIQPSGEIHAQGGPALYAKRVLNHLRILLHVALLAAPTLAFALLLGRNGAIRLAIPLALAIEAAQTAFGYGFDWVDVVDLAFDGIGIWLALRLHRRLARGLTLLDPDLPSCQPAGQPSP